MTTPSVEVDKLIEPSIETIQVIYKSLGRSVKKISDESDAIRDTVVLVGDLLNRVTGSADMSGGFDGLGLMAIPIPMAMKAVFLTFNRYVEQRTDISLESWATFINSTRMEFEDFLTQLAKVAEQAKENDKLLETQDQLNVDQLRENQDLLENTKVKTKLWRPVLAQITGLNQLIDSMLATKEKIASTPKEGFEPSAWSRNLLKKVGDTVQDVTSSEQLKFLEFVLRPIYDLQDRVSRLNDQVDKLSRLIVELEDLLDLEIAQIRANLGEVPPYEARVLGARVAVMILIPRLRDQLLETQGKVKGYESFLRKLNAANQTGGVHDVIYQNLTSEYQVKLDQSRADLSTLEQKAKIWKGQGVSALDSGAKWLQEELETVKIRELVGELPENVAKQRGKALEREIARFAQVKRLLNSL
jgi:hypothetical protein